MRRAKLGVRPIARSPKPPTERSCGVHAKRLDRRVVMGLGTHAAVSPSHLDKPTPPPLWCCPMPASHGGQAPGSATAKQADRADHPGGSAPALLPTEALRAILLSLLLFAWLARGGLAPRPAAA